jgi:hypothetical protein
MSIDLDTLLRVIDACEAPGEPQQLVSLVIPQRGGERVGQVFMAWKPGKTVREYLQDPRVHAVISLYQAAYSRIVDHRGLKRRLSHVPKPGDELRFLRVASIGEM